MENGVRILLFLCCAFVANVESQEKQRTTTVYRVDKDCADPSKRVKLEQCDWHYIAYFPRIFRTGVAENVIFSAPGFPEEVAVTVRASATSGRPIAKVERVVPAGEQMSIPLLIPHNAPSNVKVTVEGKGESAGKTWVFKNTSDTIRVEKLGLSIMIQTDRPIYKPGQKIRSRVIVVDTDLKPFSGKLDKVYIENPSGAVMRMWKDVQLEDGYAAFDLKTSVKPVLGKWKIKVEFEKYKKELKIDLQKYVLPKFQLTIKPPSFISLLMNTITAEVCARYSFGKAVRGKLSATICKRQHHRGYVVKQGEKDPSCMSIAKPIDGCTMVSVDLTKLGPKAEKKSPMMQRRIGMFGPYRRLLGYVTFEASVKETATGVERKADKVEKRIFRNELKLSVDSTSVFKPGFPVSAKILAKYHDNTPVPSASVTLRASIGGTNKNLINETTITIKNGVYNLELPTIPFSAPSVSIKVTHLRKAIFKGEKNYDREVVAYKKLTPWYSPSHSYLNIQKLKNVVKIGDKVEYTVGYTSVDPVEVQRKVTYSLMCGGNIVHSETFERTFGPAVQRDLNEMPKPTTKATTTKAPTTISKKTNQNELKLKTFKLFTLRPIIDWWRRPPATRPPLPPLFAVGNFSFSFDATRKMQPSCRMVVYYIRNEEVVADETEFDVADEFENNVSMKFETGEIKPGSPIKLTVKGAPNSRVAIAAVDKSIHFLAKGNDIKPKDLLDIREKLTVYPGYVREYGRCPSWHGRRRRGIWPGYGGGNDFVDSEKAFANVGVTLLSSLRIDVRPCVTGPIIMQMEVADSEDGLERRLIAVPGGTTRRIGIPGPVGRRKGVAKKGSGGAKKKESPRARTEFPETWLWTDEKLSAEGVRVYDVKVPDTITTWYASGFAISKAAGLGVANPTELRAFQPFFISLNLPYSVIRDEEVTVPAAVFSYLDSSCMTIKVSLAFSEDYKMIAGPNAKACLCGGRTATVLFIIKPKKLGHINIRIGAETLSDNQCAADKPFDSQVSAADLLVKKLLVEPEGVKEEYTRSSFFCPDKIPGKIFKTSYKLKLPDNLVPGSNFTRVAVMGDLMGSSLSNIDELLAMPYGCGEQNMLKFAPNIFVMNYLNNTKQVNDEIEDKALDYMRTGYQRELTYKHNDGSYSAFGKRDDSGSTWLSAFVLKTYAQARPWIDIDEKEVEVTMKWLYSLQNSDGCFKKVGKLHNKAMAGGVKTTATLTTYVLISLLEAGLLPQDIQAVAAGKCILAAHSDVEKDSYTLALMAYAFAKLKYKNPYEKTMKLLDGLAVNDDGMVHWESEKEKPVEPRGYYYRARSTDIEQTAYVLMAKMTYEGKNAIDTAVPIVRWLSKQRNSLGGWSSTQDTVLALQALAEFAELTFTGDVNMKVIAMATSGFEHEFQVNGNNKLVLQTVENVPVPTSLDITGTGTGCALVQTTVKYNVFDVKIKPTFELTHEITSIDEPLNQMRSCRPQQLKVCAKYLGEGASNMAIVDVQMISGFEADEESFDKIRGDSPNPFLKDIEVKEKSLVFYFREIPRMETCVEFRVDQTTNVRKTKPAPIKVYDYYDTGKSSTIKYEFTDKHCSPLVA